MSMTTTKKAFGWQLILLLSMTAVLTSPSTFLPAQETVPSGLRAYALRHAQASEIAPQLQKLLSDLGTRQEVLVDQSANRVLIRGPEQSTGLVEHLVQTLDRPVAAGPATTAQPLAVPTAPASPFRR
jgi:type II secretory pathway component GspD/PulD (secretin)